MESDDGVRARQRDLFRRGYDAISLAYRTDDCLAAPTSAEDVSCYRGWIAGLASQLPPGARVLDLGCGAGLPASRPPGHPATRELTMHGLQVVGVDFSAVQLQRARRLVLAARLVQVDIVTLHLAPARLDAVVSFYALIHLPLADQKALFPRLRHWLTPGGYLPAIVGAEPWTGTENYLGAPMFWDHAGTADYLQWLTDARLTPLWHRYIPEGTSGHSLILACAA